MESLCGFPKIQALVEKAARNFCSGWQNIIWEKLSITSHTIIQCPDFKWKTLQNDTGRWISSPTAHVSFGGVVHEWHGEWANWGEFPGSIKVKSLLEISQDCMHQRRNERFVAKRPSFGTRTHGHGQGFTRMGCQSHSCYVFCTMRPLPHRIHRKSFPRRWFEPSQGKLLVVGWWNVLSLVRVRNFNARLYKMQFFGKKDAQFNA